MLDLVFQRCDASLGRRQRALLDLDASGIGLLGLDLVGLNRALMISCITRSRACAAVTLASAVFGRYVSNASAAVTIFDVSTESPRNRRARISSRQSLNEKTVSSFMIWSTRNLARSPPYPSMFASSARILR
jgi:hypothetical protein